MPTVRQKLKNTLSTMQSQAEKRMDLLKNREAQNLKARMKEIDGQKNGLQEDVCVIFSKAIEQIEKEKKNQLASLEESSKYNTNLKFNTKQEVIKKLQTYMEVLDGEIRERA